jgi:phenylalanyl-tRNA synthetase alpha chain
MQNQIDGLAAKALAELGSINTIDELEAWRVRYLGRKSELVSILRSLSTLSIEEKRVVGAHANDIKISLDNAAAEKKESLESASVSASGKDTIDISLPGKPVRIGHLHPVTQTMNEMCGAFQSMGFQVVEGPEVEWERYNFESLNMPKEHPARDAFATLWMDSANSAPGALLRTHTSPVQIRVMEKTKPPIRIVAPGRVYRYEATDATHEWMFSQIEGLAIDTNITMADLKGTLFEFARKIFGMERKARFRVDYFPFVEPGVEMAIDCFACNGAGCRLCQGSGWIEILGAGMVHPEVLRKVGIDPDVYSGFAFGMGIERVWMLRYGIDDIRYFYSNDLRFLNQF